MQRHAGLADPCMKAFCGLVQLVARCGQVLGRCLRLGIAGGGLQSAIQPFGHEQDRLAVVHGGRDDIGARLRFAGPGRALDDEVASGPDGFDDARLRNVRVDDMNETGGI